MGQIADSVAHDFTNVFAVILAYANFIEEATPPGDSRREDARQILAAAGVGTTLIRQLLAVAGHTTEKKIVDLVESVAQAHALLVRALAQRCELSVTLPQSPILARIDPVRFDQIMMGLVLAACDATAPGAQVRVDLQLVAGSSTARQPIARLTVAYASASLEQAARQLLFSSPASNTTALGLSNCLRWVEDAGGTLTLRSDDAQSATFVVDLPIWEASSKRVEFDLARAGHGERVLLVETDPGLRHAAARAFERAGYQVLQAATGAEARDTLVQLGEQLEALVVDVDVTRREGGGDILSFAERVSPRVVRVLIRAFAEERETPLGVRELYKPLLPADLVYAVSQGLLELRSTTPAESREREVILVVEDDDALRSALERILNHAGYSTSMAGTLAAARAILKNEPEPRFLLCDLSLPDGSSVELLEWVRATRPSLAQRVLILSGGAIEDADLAFARSGAFPLLPKPVDAAALLRILDRSGRR
jgi:DNA-binding response OmpR family regulator